MNIRSFLSGLTASAGPSTLATIMKGLVPAGLPARLKTMEGARQHRAALSAAEDAAPVGTLQFTAIRQAAAVCDELIVRLQWSERVASAGQKSAEAGAANEQALKIAQKQHDKAVADNAAAAQALESIEVRLRALLTEREAMEAASANAVRDAEKSLRDQIEAGNDAAEKAAAAALRQAQQSASTSFALAEIDMRLAAVKDLHATRTAAAEAASAVVVAAERALLTAEFEVAALRHDVAAAGLAASVLDVARVLSLSRDSNARTLAGFEQRAIYVHDYSRVWFGQINASRRGGLVSVSEVAWELVRLLNCPLDVAALQLDLERLPAAA